MSLKTTTSSPPTSSVAIPAPATPSTGPTEPPVISFAFIKKQGLYHVIALKTQGDRVTATKVIVSDDYRPVARDEFDRAVESYTRDGKDPFAPPNMEK